MKHTSKMFRALFSAGGIQFILGFAVVVFTGQALAQGDTWDTTKASRVTATTASSAGVIAGLLYVVGGTPSGVIDVVEAYNPVSDTWTTKPPIPTPRGFAASGVINGKLYVVGGGNPFDISQVDIYDPVTNSWSTASNPMLDPRSSVSAGVIDGILYVVGGDVFGQNASVNTLRAYNPVTDTWVLKASMPTGPRQHLAVGVIDGKLYAIGGFSTCCASLDTLEVYNPLTNSWTTAAPLPVGKNQLVAGVIDGKLYAIGGIPTTGGATDDTFEYDPTTNTWASRTPIPTARFAASAGVIDGKLYVVGGSDGLSALTVLEVYTPPTTPPPVLQFRTVFNVGLNLFSPPLKPDTPLTARTLAEMTGATLIVRLDSLNQQWLPYIPGVSTGDGFTLEGAQGYIVNVLATGDVIFTGTGWDNVSAAPSGRSQIVWAFAIAGEISDELHSLDAQRIRIINTQSGEVIQSAIDGETFEMAWVDMNRRPVVQVGDVLEIQVKNGQGELISQPLRVTLNPQELHRAVKIIALQPRLLPKHTQLLQNYPNPFNPETWIPYELAVDTEVTITIYNSFGHHIRTLELGTQPANSYLVKDKAAYWDGYSHIGERVSSGIYYYHFRAGEFTATKKMIILK